MIDLLWKMFTFIISLTILVAVHEFGHFWVARRYGVYVERFSIGFGKRLWSTKDAKGTEYIIALIPLGGYVKMLDERIQTVPLQLKDQAFNNKTILQRTAIISAGPLANLLFAFLAWVCAFMIGVRDVRSLIIDVIPNSIAEKSGMSIGMELKSVDGVKTPCWNSARLELLKKAGHQRVAVEVVMTKSSQLEKKILDLRDWDLRNNTQDQLFNLGIMPCCYEFTSVLSHIVPNSPAEKAGLRIGDKIVKVNHDLLDSGLSFLTLIRKNPNQSLILEIERQGAPVILTLKLGEKLVNFGQSENKIQEGFAGIMVEILPLKDIERYEVTCRYNLYIALSHAFQKVWERISLTMITLTKLILGEISLNHLGGPIFIAIGAGAAANNGFVYYLIFLALISINLGIVNLLPLPILDGGHLLFLAMEKYIGRPISEKIQNFSYRIGLIFLLLLILIALYNDFSRF
ncbi:sigma E protease regulator RseP [Candidatus Williamhamiltonella defendens]|uniref:sigma E protease regulator RseP n=1 Tax=Candidatus Williamhamiltonella defendens TaxID=138072 RepID=UPI00130E7F0D|nr:sigma E protease regulator RseP [Candidatus Hamiltonella defensa]